MRPSRQPGGSDIRIGGEVAGFIKIVNVCDGGGTNHLLERKGESFWPRGSQATPSRRGAI
jgi:hypothetical protein